MIRTGVTLATESPSLALMMCVLKTVAKFRLDPYILVTDRHFQVASYPLTQ
jgi:hypothetical protein